MMRALIAEDEAELRAHFIKMLRKLWPELEICAEAENGNEALALCREHRPDIVFLDIRMPGKSGMEVAKNLSGCRIVFVTAYDQYAVEAFERYALDYLVKPVTEERLARTVATLKQAGAGEAQLLAKAIEQAAARLAPAKKWLQWVRAQTGDTVRLIHADDIVYFRAEDKYTVVRMADGEALIRSALKTLEAELNPENFWRIHRNTIINVRWVEKASRLPGGGLSLHLKNITEELAVSRQFAHLFRQM